MAIHIPDEIMEEHILWRLPVKSLVRFRSVSKSWLSRISSTHFFKLKSERASQIGIHKFLVRRSDQEYTFKSVDCQTSSSRLLKLPFSLSTYEANFMVGSSNGLVCISTVYRNFFLWNPTTNEYKKIPDFEFNNKYTKFGFGFGYDASSGDYKIVVVKGPTYIFSLKKGIWTYLPDTLYLDDYICYVKRAVFFNGALHWLCIERTDTESRTIYCSLLLAFGLAEESFKNISLPDNVDIDYGYTFGLDVLDGYLCLTIPWDGGDASQPQAVWIMKEYGLSSSWTKVATMHFDPGMVRLCSSLCTTRRGEILSTECSRSRPSKNLYGKVYAESLISPNAIETEH